MSRKPRPCAESSAGPGARRRRRPRRTNRETAEHPYREGRLEYKYREGKRTEESARS